MRHESPRAARRLPVDLLSFHVDQFHRHGANGLRTGRHRKLGYRENDGQRCRKTHARQAKQTSSEPSRQRKRAFDEQQVPSRQARRHRVERDHLPTEPIDLNLENGGDRKETCDDPATLSHPKDSGPGDGKHHSEEEDEFELSQVPARLREWRD